MGAADLPVRLCRLADGLGYNLAYGRASGRSVLIGFEEGEAVLSRFPIREVQRHVLLPKPGLFENRIVLRAVIDTPLGMLEVYNTHFSHRVNRDPLRLKQAADLIRFLGDTYEFRDLPALIGGDINAFPESALILRLLEEGLEDAALQIDPPADGCGLATTSGCSASWQWSDGPSTVGNP